MKHPGKAFGFTLLELLVVIVLMALTIGVVATRFSGASSGAELKTEARKMVALLRHTRTRAISESLSLGIVSLTDGSQYKIQPNGDEISLPKGVSLSISPGVDEIVVNQQGIYFYPDGSSNGGALLLQSSVGELSLSVNWLTGEVALAE